MNVVVPFLWSVCVLSALRGPFCARLNGKCSSYGGPYMCGAAESQPGAGGANDKTARRTGHTTESERDATRRSPQHDNAPEAAREERCRWGRANIRFRLPACSRVCLPGVGSRLNISSPSRTGIRLQGHRTVHAQHAWLKHEACSVFL